MDIKVKSKNHKKSDLDKEVTSSLGHESMDTGKKRGRESDEGQNDRLSRIVLVQNLVQSVNPATLVEIFRKYGTMESIDFLKGDVRAPLKTALIHYETASEALNATNGEINTKIGGQRIEVMLPSKKGINYQSGFDSKTVPGLSASEIKSIIQKSDWEAPPIMTITYVDSTKKGIKGEIDESKDDHENEVSRINPTKRTPKEVIQESNDHDDNAKSDRILRNFPKILLMRGIPNTVDPSKFVEVFHKYGVIEKIEKLKVPEKEGFNVMYVYLENRKQVDIARRGEHKTMFGGQEVKLSRPSDANSFEQRYGLAETVPVLTSKEIEAIVAKLSDDPVEEESPTKIPNKETPYHTIKVVDKKIEVPEKHVERTEEREKSREIKSRIGSEEINHKQSDHEPDFIPLDEIDPELEVVEHDPDLIQNEVVESSTSRKIAIGNLPNYFVDDDVRVKFEQYGKIREITFGPNDATIKYKKRASARDALQESGANIEGNFMSVALIEDE
jgi:RNA recognition motif-containing protein